MTAIVYILLLLGSFAFALFVDMLLPLSSDLFFKRVFVGLITLGVFAYIAWTIKRAPQRGGRVGEPAGSIAMILLVLGILMGLALLTSQCNRPDHSGYPDDFPYRYP